MTSMHDYKEMSIQQRRRVKFAPLGGQIYGGMGYMVSRRAWEPNDVDKLVDFIRWSTKNGCSWDGPVCVFPDEQTYIMARLRYE